MTYGMQIFTDSGRLSLSTEYKHWKHIKTVRLSANVMYADTLKTDYSDSVLVAFVTDSGTAFSRCAFSRKEFNIGLGSNAPDGAGIYIYSDTPATAYIYDLPTNADIVNSDYGLNVFNSSGELIFDSGNKYLKILNVYSATTLPLGSVPYVSANGATVTVPTNSTKVAVIPISAFNHVELSDAYRSGEGNSYEMEEWFGRSWYSTSGGNLNIRVEYITAYRPGLNGFVGHVIKTGICYCILVDVNGL